MEVNQRSLVEILEFYESLLPDRLDEIRQVFDSIAEDLNRRNLTLEKLSFESDPSTLVGSKIGDYHVKELISVGGFGIVYRALDTHLQRNVVVKIPRHLRFESPEEIESFVEEARKAAKLNHRNIISVFQFGVDSGIPFIIEEYATGGDLKQFLSNRLPPDKVVELTRSIVGGVGAAHASGIVHRDIKPSNILLNSSSEPLIADFGLAIKERSGTPGQIAGTVRYMSPEQIRGDSQLDGRSDIWSIGIILYELLAGPLPDDCSPEDTDVSRDRLQACSIDLDAIEDDDLRKICGKFVATNLEERYQTAEELEEDLVDFQVRSSESSFRHVAEQIPAMVLRYILRADGSHDILYVSSGIKDIFGIEPADAMRDPANLFRLVDVDDFQRLVAKREQSAKTLQRFVHNYRIENPNRGMRWCQCNSQPERLTNGDVVWDGVVLDITETKNEEQSTDKNPPNSSDTSGAKLRQMVEQLPGAVLRCEISRDRKESITFASEGFCDLIGVEPEVVQDDATVFWDRVHADDVDWLRGKLDESFENLTPFELEFRVDAPGKGTRWCQGNVKPEPLKNGNIVWSGVFLDITRQKEDQYALHQAKIEIDRITSNLPGMIFQYVRRSDGKYWMTYIGTQCRDLFEVEPDEVLENADLLFSRIHHDDLQGLLEAIRISFETMAEKRFDFRVNLPVFGVRELRCISNPTRNEDGTLRADGVVVDITD
jgi:PAS domain S-box-containing protein